MAYLVEFPAKVAKIQKLIAEKDTVLLEDCCKSRGAAIDGVNVGLGGGSFSFYWGQHMTTFDGRMHCTNDEEFYIPLLLKRSH